MKLSDLLKAAPHLAVRGDADRAVAGITCDSRQVRPDFLFVAVPGVLCDGLQYVDDAIKRGASVIVTPQVRLAAGEATHVQVENARRALAELADAFYRHPTGKLVLAGVTGTNGKTTTTFQLHDILAAAGLTPGLIGTVNYEVGARVIPASRTTPQSVELQALFDQMLHAGCKSAVMEVSSHALDQDRVVGCEFDAAVFTNLTQDHLDYHQSMERYFEAKRRLFRQLGRGSKTATAVINVDDPWGLRLAADPEIRARVLTFGCREGVDVRACDITAGPQGSEFKVVGPWGGTRIRLALLGHFNVMNALGAYGAARALGIDDRLTVDALAARRTVPGRLEEVPTRRGWRVFVDYAHTDDALANVLRTVRELTPARLILVFGCGGSRDQAKRPLMGHVAAGLADHTILTSDNPRREEPRAIIAQIEAGFGACRAYDVVEDRAQAIETALRRAREGDIVLIAGKGHETTQEFANTIVPFDDRQVVRTLLQTLTL
jgi:UDP-N-acetylmuramoyl-L-alanyl-D-glutamate--2,6-diaminopimelate ligase